MVSYAVFSIALLLSSVAIVGMEVPKSDLANVVQEVSASIPVVPPVVPNSPEPAPAVPQTPPTTPATPPVVNPVNPPVAAPAPQGSIVVPQNEPVVPVTPPVLKLQNTEPITPAAAPVLPAAPAAPSVPVEAPKKGGCTNDCLKDILPPQKDGYFKSLKNSIATKYTNASKAVANSQVVTYLKAKKDGGWAKLTTTEKTVGVLAAAATLALATYVTYKIYKAATAKKEQKKSVRYNRNN